jgi:hypothetical protein
VAPLVCERYAGPVCADASWAQWPIPNNPADTGTPNLASYTDNGNGTVIDNVTGLMWQKASSPGQYVHTQAVAYCPTLTLGGRTDWRLPSQIELLSIVDYGVGDPSINSTYFPSTPGSGFWSSTVVTGVSTTAWSVSFGDGLTYSIDNLKSIPAFARCVR